jgi:hypothetical protein
MPKIAPTLELAYAIRMRVVPAIFAVEEYQQPDADAPKAPLYVRETILEETAEQYSQGMRRWSFLVELDIFCDRVAYPSPKRTLESKADEIKLAFDPDGEKLAIDGFRVWIDGLPQCQSMDQEEELYRLPVTFSVVIVG